MAPDSFTGTPLSAIRTSTMFRPFIALLAVLVLAMASPRDARALEDLYTGVVPVTGQGEAERAAALPDALLHVLRKLSGQRDIPPQAELDVALAGAADLLLAFGYREVPRPRADGTEQDELRLEARFAPPAVDRLVRDLGLRRWRVEREPVVLWPIVDDGRSRTLMPIEYQLELDRMMETAERRGLPVAWPGLSAELMAQVDVQLLWGGYTEQLVGEGSATEGVAIVAARREGPQWNVRWTYADASTSTSWRTRDTDLGLALEEGAHQLTDLVASVNAIEPAGQGDFQADMLITDLLGSSDYARCLAYLSDLSLVDAVDVLGVGPAGVRLRLDLNAEPGYLRETLLRDGVMVAGDVPGEYRLER